MSAARCKRPSVEARWADPPEGPSTSGRPARHAVATRPRHTAGRSAPWRTSPPDAVGCAFGPTPAVGSCGRPLHRWIRGVSPARRPVSRVLYRGSRRGDGHPSGAAGCPTALAADPRAGQRTSPPGEPGLRPPIWPCSGWSLPRFTPAPRGRHRHCGTGPRLTADGRYPPPCAGELGLSSRLPVARPTRDHPAASLARALYGGGRDSWPNRISPPEHPILGRSVSSRVSANVHRRRISPKAPRPLVGEVRGDRLAGRPGVQRRDVPCRGCPNSLGPSRLGGAQPDQVAAAGDRRSHGSQRDSPRRGPSPDLEHLAHGRGHGAAEDRRDRPGPGARRPPGPPGPAPTASRYAAPVISATVL